MKILPHADLTEQESLIIMYIRRALIRVDDLCMANLSYFSFNN